MEETVTNLGTWGGGATAANSCAGLPESGQLARYSEKVTFNIVGLVETTNGAPAIEFYC